MTQKKKKKGIFAKIILNLLYAKKLLRSLGNFFLKFSCYAEPTKKKKNKIKSIGGGGPSKRFPFSKSWLVSSTCLSLLCHVPTIASKLKTVNSYYFFFLLSSFVSIFTLSLPYTLFVSYHIWWNIKPITPTPLQKKMDSTNLSDVCEEIW